MGGALGLRATRGERFGRRLSGAAREQPATVGVGPPHTLGGVLRDPRGARTANGRGVRPPGSSTRLKPSSADRPHPGWVDGRAIMTARESNELLQPKPFSSAFCFGMHYQVGRQEAKKRTGKKRQDLQDSIN